MDYLIGLLLIAAPWLLAFADGGAAQWVAVILGAGVILYSLITDYELSIARVVPMPVHLALDVGGGALLAVSPWLFGFSEEVWLPHVIVGVLEIGAGLVTHTRADDEVRAGRRERTQVHG